MNSYCCSQFHLIFVIWQMSLFLPFLLSLWIFLRLQRLWGLEVRLNLSKYLCILSVFSFVEWHFTHACIDIAEKLKCKSMWVTIISFSSWTIQNRWGSRMEIIVLSEIYFHRFVSHTATHQPTLLTCSLRVFIYNLNACCPLVYHKSKIPPNILLRY